MKYKILIVLLLWIQCVACFALPSVNKNITIQVDNASLADTIKMFANDCGVNVIVSPRVTGTVSLHLQNVSASKALEMLLTSHDLYQWQEGNLWYIAPEDELLQREQAHLKIQNLQHESSPVSTKCWRIHYAKAEDIARLLQDGSTSLLSKTGHVRVDARTNMLCIQDTEDRLPDIVKLVQRLDVPVQQVLIEAHLASMDNDCQRILGINFTQEVSQYNLAVIKFNHGLTAQLAALEKTGHGELISNPSLFTANQQTASIEAGEEIPYQEVSEGGGTGVAFKKAVLSLKVTPQIMPGNRVLLQLQITQDKPSSHIILGVPAISTRQMVTNLLVKNGQTVVLGGIYEADRENGQQQIPFLGRIPFIGWLFKQQSNIDQKRELLVFVTPKIMT